MPEFKGKARPKKPLKSQDIKNNEMLFILYFYVPL